MSRLASIAVLAFVGACGGGGTSGPNPPPPPPPPPAPVASVSVAPDNLTLVPLQTGSITATPRDAAGNPLSGRATSWSSTTPAVATVDANGLVTAASAGSANILATSEGKSGVAAVNVLDGAFLGPAGGQASAASGNVTLIVPAAALASNTAITIAAVQNPPPDPKLAPGTAYNLGPNGTQFAQAVTIRIKYDPALLMVGTTLTQLRIARLSGATWIALAGSTVDVATRTVTGQTSSFSTYAVLEVVPTVASVVIAPTPVTLDVGESTNVNAAVLDGSGQPIPNKTVQWFTSDGAVVGGTANGNSATLQGVAAGNATVTATVDGITGSLPVTVRPTAPRPVATVTLTPASALILVGQTLPMVATLRDAQGNVLTGRSIDWFSSDISIVNGTVAGNLAVLQGLSVGVVTISATSEGVTGFATVGVVGSITPIPLTCTGVAGGRIYAQNGQYLGRLTNQFDNESILNTFGPYGSQFSSTSIYNSFSQYGSQFASLSAYNSFTNTPPQLYVGQQFVAYVSKNTFRTPRIDPDALRACSFP